MTATFSENVYFYNYPKKAANPVSVDNDYRRTASPIALTADCAANAVVSSRYNTLYGETISYGEKNCMLQCSYRIKNFNVGAGMLYPFQPKGWSGGTKLLSNEVRKETWSFIKDNGNMFLLTLSWDFSVGKKHNAEGKTTNNVDRETGIVI